MGVHGLWRLIEPSGKPVPLETLENKILAVDISIWLHQAIKGFQDSRGAPLPNAHLLGIYHRICKLLYFRIKPIFVFDGGVPVLKKQTIAKRNQQKIKNLNEATDIQTKLLKTLLKQSAVNKILAENPGTFQNTKTQFENEKSKEDLFKLPELPATEQHDSTLDSSYSSDDDYESSSSSPTKQWDLQTIDEKSVHFKSLPADVRHEILTEIKETRKQSSWGRIHEMPTESGEFSSFQMKRLLKRYSVQISLEEAEKEMGGHTLSLGELETLLNEEGIVTDSKTGSRIASNENARYLLIKDVQKAMEQAKKEEETKSVKTIEEQISSEEVLKTESNISTVDKEFQHNLAAAIQLSLQDQPSTSKDSERKAELSYLENFNDGDFESESESDEEKLLTRLKSAKSYMIEYSGLTPSEIEKIITTNTKTTKVPIKQTINVSETKLKENMIHKITVENKLSDKTENEERDINIVNKNIETENITELDDNCIDISEKNKFAMNKNDNREEKELKITNKEDTKIQNIFDSEDTFINVSNKIESLKKDKSKNKTTEIQLSDLDDTDFVEVKNPTELNSVKSNSNLEILINPNDSLQDDIFSDIFSEVKSKNQKLGNVLQLKTGYKSEVIEKSAMRVEHKKGKEMKASDAKPEENKTQNIVDNREILNSKTSENEVRKDIDKIIELEKPRLTTEELNILKSDLVAEQEQLMSERNKKERIAGNITDQMYQEAQELLELFGVPYIIAPMEAEAQCAFLNEINLTDGTITDDSDIWLFGGKTVYKNFFNHNKHVLEFRSESLEYHFKLTREQLILLALLVGSDYTMGVQGIGPVTALEILAAFPPSKAKNINVLTQDELISGLIEFRKWLSDNKVLGIGRTALRSKLRNVSLLEGFPNLQVIQAYLQPKVETCSDSFSWAKPDVVGLIDYAREKFGWTRLKSEEILKPVMKKLEDKNIQRSIKDYFAVKHKTHTELADYKLSKRVKTAIKRMGKSTEDPEEEKTKTAKKRISYKTKEPNISKSNTNENNNASIVKRKLPIKKEKNVKEYIHQREKDKMVALKSKLKAIEVFRKSKQGPGYVQKRQKLVTPIKETAELSESSSD